MKITVHRGTHQIGGVATEISSEKSRIIIDMGDELSLDPDFVPRGTYAFCLFFIDELEN